MWISSLVTTALMVVLLYIVAGIIFGITLYIKGLSHLDQGAKGSSWGFKMLIFPGIVVFWPWLWRKWSGRS